MNTTPPNLPRTISVDEGRKSADQLTDTIDTTNTMDILNSMFFAAAEGPEFCRRVCGRSPTRKGLRPGGPSAVVSMDQTAHASP